MLSNFPTSIKAPRHVSESHSGQEIDSDGSFPRGWGRGCWRWYPAGDKRAQGQGETGLLAVGAKLTKVCVQRPWLTVVMVLLWNNWAGTSSVWSFKQHDAYYESIVKIDTYHLRTVQIIDSGEPLKWKQWVSLCLFSGSRLSMWFKVKGMATHSNILAWRIPWTEEPGRLQSIGLLRVGHDWNDLAHTQSNKISQEQSPCFCPRRVC